MTLLDLPSVLDRVSHIAQTIAAPAAHAVDKHAQWPEASIRALQAAELGGLVIPTRGGGLGHGLLALARVSEMLGEVCASSALCFGMHCVGSAVLAAKVTPYQQEQYLAPICAGTHLTTLALSEPATGAHFYLPATHLRLISPNTYEVHGSKTFVTNGDHADSYVVSTVAAEPHAPPGQFSCVVIPKHQAGMHWGDPWYGVGMRGNASRMLTLHNVTIPRTHVLGNEGDEIWYIFTIIAPYFLMAMAGTYLGIAQAALTATKHHLITRVHHHTGRPLAAQPILQERFGTLWAQVERTRHLIYAAAQAGDRSDPAALPLLTSAKAEVADCVVAVVNEAMTLMGGIGYREDGHMSRLLRDARAAHIMSPTTDLLRLWTSRFILDQPLFAE